MDKKQKIALIVNSVFAYLIILFDILYLTRKQLEVDWLVNPYILKSTASGLFVACGLFNLIYCYKNNFTANKRFMILLFTGLVFAMLGDIFLIDFFILGAGLFAVGHIFFFIAFCTLSKVHYLDFVCGGIIFAFSLLIILLYPKFDFKNMIFVVICYALIISLMLGKAISSLRLKDNKALNVIIFFGALMFYLSDLMLVFEVFAPVPFIFDTFCLALYYPAEFILAFSIYFGGVYYKKADDIVKNNIKEN